MLLQSAPGGRPFHGIRVRIGPAGNQSVSRLVGKPVRGASPLADFPTPDSVKDASRADELRPVPIRIEPVDAHAEVLVGGVDETLAVDHHAHVPGPVAHDGALADIEEDQIAGDRITVDGLTPDVELVVARPQLVVLRPQDLTRDPPGEPRAVEAVRAGRGPDVGRAELALRHGDSGLDLVTHGITLRPAWAVGTCPSGRQL